MLVIADLNVCSTTQAVCPREAVADRLIALLPSSLGLRLAIASSIQLSQLLYCPVGDGAILIRTSWKATSEISEIRHVSRGRSVRPCIDLVNVL